MSRAPDQPPQPAERLAAAPEGAALGCGHAILWTLAMTACSLLAHLAGRILPFDNYVLPPASILLFGPLAGLAQGYPLRQPNGSLRPWIRASALAGLIGGAICILPTGLAATSAGLYAGWAYAWAAYGAAHGVLTEKAWPGQRWILQSTLAWTIAGVVAGLIGWHGDVMRISGTTELLFHVSSTMSRTWPIGAVLRSGVLVGLIGGALSGASLTLRSVRHQILDDNDRRTTMIAGIVCGGAAVLLGTFVSPVLVTILLKGSLASLDIVVFFLNLAAGSIICVPTYGVVCVPLAVACARVGLRRARSIGAEDPRLWVWLWAAAGGVVGYVITALVAYAIGAME